MSNTSAICMRMNLIKIALAERLIDAELIGDKVLVSKMNKIGEATQEVLDYISQIKTCETN